jgi:hypothetical protein
LFGISGGDEPVAKMWWQIVQNNIKQYRYNVKKYHYSVKNMSFGSDQSMPQAIPYHTGPPPMLGMEELWRKNIGHRK